MPQLQQGSSAEANLTAAISLHNQQSQRALEILEDELVALRPSKWQRAAYQILHLDVAVFVIALGIAAVVGVTPGQPASPACTATGFAGLLATLALLVLIPVNVPLFRSLRRSARIRRQLGWDEPLDEAFLTQRRRRWLGNLATAILVLLGVYLAIQAALVAILAFRLDALPLSMRVVLLIIAVLYVVVGVTLVGLHFVRRAMDRFAVVVERVQGRVNAAVEQSRQRGTGDVAVGPADYELITQVERDQIMRDRLESVQQHEDRDDAGYAVLFEPEAQHARAALSPADRVLVDERIFGLADRRASRLKQGLQDLRVGGTRATVLFEMNHETRRIRIVRIVESDLDTAQPS